MPGIISICSTLLRLTRSFHPDLLRYLAGVLLRQALIVAGGYSMVLAIRMCSGPGAASEWLFIALFVVFDAGLLSLDLGLNRFFSSRLVYPLFGRLRIAALEKIFELPLEWHHARQSGRLAGEVNQGVGKVVQTAEGISRELIPAILRTIFSLIPLLWTSPLAVPAALAAFGGFLWLSILENRERAPYRRSRYQNYTRDYGLFAECVQQVRPVIQFGQQERLIGVYARVQRAIEEQGVEEIRAGNVYAWRRNLLLSVTKRLCQGYWIYQFRRHALDAALVMYLSMLLEDLLNSFWGYAALLERIAEGMEPARLFVELLEERPAIADLGSAPVPVPAEVGMRLVNVRFAYPGRDPVMQDLTLEIEPGAVTGIVGRSGGGKTTIHNLLARLFEVQEGSIEISGTDIRHWPLGQLRGLFSCVTQDGGVFFSEMTLEDTIRFARPDASAQEVRNAAVCACIHEDILKLPQGYGTRLGERGLALSKGQQQRIALAQALLAMNQDKKILVLDEFTSALDSETERRMLSNLKPWLAGRTVIVVAHRLSTLKNIAGRIVVLDEGRVAEQGSHQELIARGGWYAEMARVQAVA